ncbi:MAG: DUF2851 family protein [Saprospiraceae bacterium]|nr:DUF2851 family protein [Saprospiraceae bacterium]
MNEALISFIWTSKKLLAKSLFSTSGKKLRIIHPGTKNHNQGPDFLFAKIEVDHILWVGQIEIHVKSSDWFKHNHQGDANYQNLILHVVWENDLLQEDAMEKFPVLELKSVISAQDFEIYNNLMKEPHPIPCINLIHQVSSLVLTDQIERASVERLQIKSNQIDEELSENKFDWDSLFYQKMCYYMVSPVNVDAMNQLTKRVNFRHVLKLSSDALALEALMFAVSGLLPSHSDHEWIQQLISKGQFFIDKFNLSAMQAHNWYFLRMRPAHFPTIRIAQIASFFHQTPRPFEEWVDCSSVKEAKKQLRVKASDYWDSHYQFSDRTHPASKKWIGTSTADLILINVICPMLFKYGQYYSKPKLIEKSLNWLEQLKPENNKPIRVWSQTGFKTTNARQSQGVLHQLNGYCNQKKCLECKIGFKLMEGF